MMEWFDLIEYLMDLILDDRDHLAADLFLDSDPAHSGVLKARLGIPTDYFTAIPVDPTPEQLEVMRSDLRRICGRPWAWGSSTVCVIEDAPTASWSAHVTKSRRIGRKRPAGSSPNCT
jgi:hypothetical protein